MTAPDVPQPAGAAAMPVASPPPVSPRAPAPPVDWRAATIPRWTVVPLRMYLGSGFMLETIGRVGHWSRWHDEVQGFLNGYLPYAASFYQPFMSGVALRHIDLFAELVFLGEAAVAVSLLLGVATRVGAVIGILLSLNYLLSKGNTPWSLNNDTAFIAGMLVVMLTRAGRTAGADAWFARRFPRAWMW